MKPKRNCQSASVVLKSESRRNASFLHEVPSGLNPPINGVGQLTASTSQHNF